jgi:hypothetical protein
VRSSPASVVSSLELPPVTAADRAVGALVALATSFLAWRVARLGGSMAAWLPWVLGGAGIVTGQVVARGRAMRLPVRRLVACADGSLWLHTAGRAPCRMAIGVGTRLVGPSVFLDLGVASNPSAKRIRTWLTPFDVPAQAIRRWCVILPRAGQVAGS